MGNEASIRRQHHSRYSIRISRQSANHTHSDHLDANISHLGNSAYVVKLYVDTIASGLADKIVSCCDIRLTKLSYGVHDHDYATKNLEIIKPTTSITPYICADCGEWKTYYRKCL
ncbi:2Fe-2S ferredoxin-type iron-sulfur-binding region protein [Faustovirus]|nr:2Fe-2S ferredoxin-type iron-sulfur-binding region protein [Faustovirus]SMH63342.1 Hypothetical protein FSTVLC9_307 [Faustovirus]